MTDITTQTVDHTQIQNVPVYKIPAFAAYPQLTHIIFTRSGGVSQGAYQSLNLSTSVGDAPAAVQQNFETACRLAGVPPAQTVSSHLVHGREVAVIDSNMPQTSVPKVDGLVTAQPDVFLFMRFADCTPLLFFDPVRRAVGLTHAGWRGTMQNVAGATVKAMVTRLGCRPADIIAAIGPAIGPCCYEVGAEVISAVKQNFNNYSQLLTANGRPNHAHFDLWQANRQQLQQAGVAQIISSNICTACHTDEFFSHRAERGRTGRFGVIIGLRSHQL